MKDQGTKPSIPNFLYSALGVLMINLIIFVLLYVIIAAEFAVSMITLLCTILVMLYLDKKGLINEIFSIFIKYKRTALISTVVLALIFPLMLADKRYIAHIAIIVTVYGMAALGLNFQMGSTNMVNFAPAAFMGIGAYSIAVLTAKFGMSSWVALAIAILTSGLMGLLIGIPTLRTKDYYLSLVTMALQLAFTMVLFNIPYLGGPNGISGVKPLSIGEFSLVKSYTVFGVKIAPQIPYLYLCILILALFIYIAMRIYISRIGLSLNTIAQDEVAANCLGINIAARKLFAFVIGAIFCGVAGALYGSYTSYVGPDDFGFPKSLMIICMVILGGMDNVVGVVTGAFILTVITEKLRVFSDFQQLVYGLILLTVLIVRPAGLIPKRVRNYCMVFKKNIVKHTQD
ncbi:MAG: branched-chain amino acid ABC transporter permease [Bacillota bacterium]|jgi:branched-chain amino acid transport system permease protein|nr:branched-chain amino acid ABC transporter permease [Clostridia bacterium]